jgi:threonine/homoserine/homoserine lactone efflux protein
MDPVFLVRGVVLGFTIAAAVGPISLLTIRRTIAHGRLYGLVSGMGVATADATYAGIAALGLTAAAGALLDGQRLLEFLGGIVLIILALRTIASRPGEVATSADRPSLPGAYATIFALTMTNPMTILSFAAAFVGLGLVGHGRGGAALLTLGVFVGSALWWVSLTSVVGRLRARVSLRWLVAVNQVSGAAILAFGILALVSAVAATASA